MIGYFSKLLKQPDGSESFGIQTSKGVIHIPKSAPTTPNDIQSPEPPQPHETKQEFEKRRAGEQMLDALLEGKFGTDVQLADDLEYAKFLEEGVIRGSKELDILREAADFLKNAMIKKDTLLSGQEVNISLADKSELVVWVYKELREQQQKNEALRKDLMSVKASYDDKLEKIDSLQRTVTELRAQNEKLIEKVKKVTGEKIALEKLLWKHSQKYTEMCKMESNEVMKIAKENRKLKEKLEGYRKALEKKKAKVKSEAPTPTVSLVKEDFVQRVEKGGDEEKHVIEVEVGLESVLFDKKVGPIFIGFLDMGDLLNLMLLSKKIYEHLRKWDGLAKCIFSKLASKYSQRIQEAQDQLNAEKAEAERIRKEFDIQSDPEMPKIYKKYITEYQEHPVEIYIEKALKHSRQFIFSHEVYTIKEESKGLFGSVFGRFSKKGASPTIELCEEELKEEELAKLPELENKSNLENLYKGLQQSVARRVNDQNEVNKWFYNLQLCFCENYIALANLLPVALELYKLVKLVYTKFEYFKKKADTLESKCEDLSAKYSTEREIKEYLAGKLRGLEGMQIKITTDIIQQRKEAMIAKEKAAELAENKEKLEKENADLKRIITKKVKSMDRKLERAKTDKEKLADIFRFLYDFFTVHIQNYLT